ncbi:S14 family endopeptidase ClpA [Oceanobacillus picturae]|uniref:S14 family endopeptidase ClpA n=1 Tax=Oceanobacillus picturae TaxID=171693 RepID=A0A0U9HF75_9BACI|nr:AAA family ATPase [Oceanobacillus picturae]GAQ19873.1 S14 family endopeptidase ClpA [Oceanobacillus picturae]
MDIEIYFEPRTKFDKRTKTIDNKIFFGRIIRNLTSNITLETVLAEFQDELEVCVITLEDCSGINSHVFESIADIISIFESHSSISKLMINNPPKFFYDKLKQLEDPIREKKYNYPQIKVNQINQIKAGFDAHIIGQASAKKAICRKLISQIIRPSKKPLVLMFYGNPGIGKTETAKYISKSLFKKGTLLREQMTMVGGEASVKFFKSTSHNEDSFSKHLLNRTSNVILLDEFALAPSFFHTSFYQMFDEGYYTDQNFTVDVSNSVIICTSNLLSVKEMEANIDTALLSRFDGFIHFLDFTVEDKKLIVKNLVDEFMSIKNMKQEYSKKLKRELIIQKVEQHLSHLTNVRNIRKYIEDVIADMLMNDILEN